MRRFRASVILPVLALVLAAAGGVVAGTQSSDEQALQPAGARGDVERRVNALVARMTLREKLEQIQLLPDFMVTEDEVRDGLGSVLSVTDPQRIRELQRIAVEESRLKIPLLFAFDTIHGFRTIFPIPLAAGASFDPRVAFDDHTYGARESAAVGLKQTYAPMVDVSHEPRWGRIAEAAGSCGSSSGPACSSTRTRRSPPSRPRPRCCDRTRSRPPARPPAARWSCSGTRAGSCPWTRPRRRR